MKYLAALALAALACVQSALVRSEPLVSITQSPETMVVSGDVNLRDNPEGIGASSVIDTLAPGDVVVLIQQGETWCRVRRVNSRVAGWALCQYLTRNLILEFPLILENGR